MKICYIIDVCLNDGGAPNSSHILAKEMSRHGHEVFVIMPWCERHEYEDASIHYVKLKKFKASFPFDVLHPFLFLRLAKELKKKISYIKPDIIHAEMPRCARAVSLLRRLGLIDSAIKLFFTDREYAVGLKKRYKILYGQTVAKNFDCIINLSKSGNVFWQRAVKKGETAVIPNCGGKIFDVYSELDVLKARAVFNTLALNRVNIIFVGRMTYEKRWELAKQVVFKLNERLKDKINIIFVFAYRGSEQEKEATEYVSSFKGIQNIYTYFNLTADKLSLLYYLSDIHVITSCRESFGRTAIEAMSRKNAVISTDAGGIKETIGLKGFIVDDDPNVIEAHIEKYVLNPDLLNADKEKLYQYYCSKYTTDKHYEIHERLYRRILSSETPPKPVCSR